MTESMRDKGPDNDNDVVAKPKPTGKKLGIPLVAVPNLFHIPGKLPTQDEDLTSPKKKLEPSDNNRQTVILGENFVPPSPISPFASTDGIDSDRNAEVPVEVLPLQKLTPQKIAAAIALAVVAALSAAKILHSSAKKTAEPQQEAVTAQVGPTPSVKIITDKIDQSNADLKPEIIIPPIATTTPSAKIAPSSTAKPNKPPVRIPKSDIVNPWNMKK